MVVTAVKEVLRASYWPLLPSAPSAPAAQRSSDVGTWIGGNSRPHEELGRNDTYSPFTKHRRGTGVTSASSQTVEGVSGRVQEAAEGVSGRTHGGRSHDGVSGRAPMRLAASQVAGDKAPADTDTMVAGVVTAVAGISASGVTDVPVGDRAGAEAGDRACSDPSCAVRQ